MPSGKKQAADPGFGSAAVFVSIVMGNQLCGVFTELMPPQSMPVYGSMLLPVNIAVTGPLRYAVPLLMNALTVKSICQPG